MKNSFAHIAFFSVVTLLLVSATYLVYSQWSNDSAQKSAVARYEAVYGVDGELAVIDSVRFFENPCYTYCATKSDDGCKEKVEQLKKMVLTVEQNGRGVHHITADDLKKMAPNTSLNMMLESYTVSRKKSKEGISYYVTVESFDAILEKIQNDNAFMSEFKEVYETFRAKDIAEMLDRTCARERVQELRRKTERAL